MNKKYGKDHALSHKLISLFDEGILSSTKFLYIICHHPIPTQRLSIYTSKNITVFDGCDSLAQHVPL